MKPLGGDVATEHGPVRFEVAAGVRLRLEQAEGQVHFRVGDVKTASVYSIVVHAFSSIVAIATLMLLVSRTVTDTSARR